MVEWMEWGCAVLFLTFLLSTPAVFAIIFCLAWFIHQHIQVRHVSPLSSLSHLSHMLFLRMLAGKEQRNNQAQLVAKFMYHCAGMIVTIVPICRNKQKWCTNVLGRNLSPMYLCEGREKACTNVMASKISVYQCDSFVVYQCDEKLIFS